VPAASADGPLCLDCRHHTALPRTAAVDPKETSDSPSLLKNLFGLRIGWQTKITTDEISSISSVEENVGHRL
jgi:hypothetical protein